MTKQRRLAAMLRTTPRAGLLALTAIFGFTAGACFNGLDADGLPCETDAQCGPGSPCLDGFCSGLFLCDPEGFDFIDATRVCDGEPDCPDEQDEAFELCFGSDQDAFSCEDGQQIPLEQECNGELDCDDESDEHGLCVGVGANTCGGGIEDIAHTVVAAHPGVPDPLKLEVTNLQGMPSNDAVLASNNGDSLRIVFDLDATDPKDHVINVAPRTIIDFEIGNVNGDNEADLVIAAASSQDGIGIYVYANSFPNPPVEYGTVVQIPNIISPTLQGIELGDIDNDGLDDIVAIADSGMLAQNGRIFVGLGTEGDPGPGSYFTPELSISGPLAYDTFLDSDMADLDMDGDDDLLVAGLEGTAGKIWVLRRNGDMVDSWAPLEKLNLQLGPTEIALGNALMAPDPTMPMAMGPSPDIAVLDRLMGRVLVVRNNMGTFNTMGTILELEGSEFEGLSYADINCDGRGDVLLGASGPQSIRAYLGDDDGDLNEEPILFELDADPRGGIGVINHDSDGTPDIMFAVDGGTGGAEVMVLGSTPLGGE